MSTVSDFNMVDDCDKIDALSIILLQDISFPTPLAF